MALFKSKLKRDLNSEAKEIARIKTILRERELKNN